MGDGMVGEACIYGGVVEATDDCDENSACWNGICTAFCAGTPLDPVCPADTICSISNQGSIAFCLEGCNPLTQECPEGEACFWDGGEFSCNFTTQDIPTGQPCAFINDCAGGNMCLSGELVPSCNGAACCAAFCDLDCGEGVCGPDTVCVPFFEEGAAPEGSADIGLCLAM
jgi:hypothetical protein